MGAFLLAQVKQCQWPRAKFCYILSNPGLGSPLFCDIIAACQPICVIIEGGQ
jgi:hypothetical protein